MARSRAGFRGAALSDPAYARSRSLIDRRARADIAHHFWPVISLTSVDAVSGAVEYLPVSMEI
jgi:hypothetical protein